MVMPAQGEGVQLGAGGFITGATLARLSVSRSKPGKPERVTAPPFLRSRPGPTRIACTPSSAGRRAENAPIESCQLFPAFTSVKPDDIVNFGACECSIARRRAPISSRPPPSPTSCRAACAASAETLPCSRRSGSRASSGRRDRGYPGDVHDGTCPARGNSGRRRVREVALGLACPRPRDHQLSARLILAIVGLVPRRVPVNGGTSSRRFPRARHCVHRPRSRLRSE